MTAQSTLTLRLSPSGRAGNLPHCVPGEACDIVDALTGQFPGSLPRPLLTDEPATDDQFELWDLTVEVVGDPEAMVCSHVPGVAFTVSGENLRFEAGRSFSLYALAAILPLLPAKQRVTHDHDWMTTDSDIACPDPHCGARFRITRAGKSTFRHSETTVVPLNQDDDG